MNYQETISYLFTSAPLFQQVGKAAYKEGLSNTLTLDEHFDHPHQKYNTIHIAGTNGKGSTAHTIAAILQHHGYRVGLYTSPHLIDFRERIRVNGEKIEESFVVRFVEQNRSFFEPLHPSFFELTTALAFLYFATKNVDVAVIEVGLGGRLDCTNIISPELSIITNISFDHTQFLGNTLSDIAKEKAGIIKANTPVVIGETCKETRIVFQEKAKEMHAPISFAEDELEIIETSITPEHLRHYSTSHWGNFESQLTGECQIKNTATILTAARLLKERFEITEEDVHHAFRNVCTETGLMGRWQTLFTNPTTVCDTGHNMGGWVYLSKQLHDISEHFNDLHIIFGMASDKDVESIAKVLPSKAHYYWTKASVHRAMSEHKIESIGKEFGLEGESYPTVSDAYVAAKQNVSAKGFIYIGGSSFVVADLLSYLQHNK